MDDAVLRLLRAVASIEPRFGIRACVIGGIARGIWAQPRATADVDVVVDTPDPASVTALAGELGLVVDESEVRALEAAAMTRLRLPEESSGATRIDVIARSHEYYDRVLERSVVVQALGLEIRVASAEDVVVLKALADRPQDRLDIAAIVEAQGEHLDRALIRRECAALDIELPEPLT
jgi:predicted nucleotidyltransferase